MDRAVPKALFEDRHTDARMRRTVPEFAVLGAVLVATTAPFLVPTTGRRLFVLGLAATAVALAFATSARGLIDRMQRSVLWVLLCSYCVLIALTVAASETPRPLTGCSPPCRSCSPPRSSPAGCATRWPSSRR